VQDQLHTWLFEKHEQGMAISIMHVMWKAQKFIGPEFTGISFNAKFMVTKLWLKKFVFVYRMQTNEATRAPAVVAGEALAFLLATRPLLAGPHRYGPNATLVFVPLLIDSAEEGHKNSQRASVDERHAQSNLCSHMQCRRQFLAPDDHLQGHG
jgi:hypothetical protein